MCLTDLNYKLGAARKEARDKAEWEAMQKRWHCKIGKVSLTNPYEGADVRA